MKFEGTETIKAPRQKVWDYLVDPHKVTECAPGVQKIEVKDPAHFRVVAGIGFGMVKVTFDNDVEFVELTAPNQAKVKVHGKAPGSAMDALATMSLSDGESGSTVLNWQAEINIVGQIAALASRMMGTMAKQLTGAFFGCVRKKIEA
jgi:carbon monoxide dehydrogenase subunit G